MLQINWQDVANILTLCIPYLIGFGVVAVLGILACIACRKLKKSTKYLIRRESILAIVLALAVVVNLICFGPMNSLLTLSTGEGKITEESLHESEALVEEIVNEGIVLLKKDGQCLPMAGTALNVFGWSSTNPCYGGVGSGAMLNTVLRGEWGCKGFCLTDYSRKPRKPPEASPPFLSDCSLPGSMV